MKELKFIFSVSAYIVCIYRIENLLEIVERYIDRTFSTFSHRRELRDTDSLREAAGFSGSRRGGGRGRGKREWEYPSSLGQKTGQRLTQNRFYFSLCLLRVFFSFSFFFFSFFLFLFQCPSRIDLHSARLCPSFLARYPALETGFLSHISVEASPVT